MSDVRVISENGSDQMPAVGVNYGDYEEQFDFAGEAYDDAARRVRSQRSHMADLREDVLRIERLIAKEQKYLDKIEQIHDDLVVYL